MTAVQSAHKGALVTIATMSQHAQNYDQGWGLPSKIHVKFHVGLQGFSNMASDRLATVLPANQMPGLKIFVN